MYVVGFRQYYNIMLLRVKHRPDNDVHVGCIMLSIREMLL